MSLYLVTVSPLIPCACAKCQIIRWQTHLTSQQCTVCSSHPSPGQGGARPLVACRYREAGCGLRFSSGRPQLRLQHEAACRHVTVGCHWTGDTCRHVPLRGAERHLLAEHGDTVRRVEQRGELAVSLAEGAAAWAGHGEASWPDTLGCCGPRVIIVR